jgi:hypothetical protein
MDISLTNTNTISSFLSPRLQMAQANINKAINDKNNGVSIGLDEYIYDETPRVLNWQYICLSTTGDAPSIVTERFNDYKSLIKKFINGKATLDDVYASVEGLFQTMLNVNIANNLISGNDPNENGDVLSHAYFAIRRRMVEILQMANANEGLIIARQQGIMQPLNSNSWVYYNSDYHYFDKDLTAIINTVAYKFANENNVKNIDFEKYYSSCFVGDGSFTSLFNSPNGLVSGIQQKNAPMLNSGRLIDPNLTPPVGFKFFYSEYVSKIEAENGMMYKRIMLVNSKMVVKDGKFDGDKFNAFDFWGDSNIKNITILDFIKNFDIYRNILGVPIKENAYEKMML